MSTLSDEQWAEVWNVFRAAHELPPDDRPAFIERIANSPEIADEVLAMFSEPEDIPCAPGQQIGHYQVIALLGRGGMGEVYSARDTELDRMVALKFVNQRAAVLHGAIGLLREAKAASALNHPNIVTVHEVIRLAQDLAMATEFVEGTSLRHWCHNGQPVEQVARWVEQVCAGLQAAHTHGIVHGDIKPENIMVRPDGLVKILDFGLARWAGSPEDLNEVPLGTLGYMSPEQLACSRLTGKSDIFSLGVVLHELTTGIHPFLRETAAQTTQAIAAGSITLPERKKRPRGAPLEALIHEMLAQASDDRPSADAVSRRLGEIRGAQSNTRIRWMPIAAVAAIVGLALAAWFWRGQTKAQITPHFTAFTTYEGSETEPAFSPDGKRIAFAWTGESGFNRNIYVKAIGGESAQALTSGPADSFSPQWSPDGRWVAFVRRAPDTNEGLVMLVASAGGEPRQVSRIIDPEGFPEPLGWWPDSRSLVVRDATPQGIALVRLNLDDGKKQALTHPPPLKSDGLPVLSPDGRHMAFNRRETGFGAICILNLEDMQTDCIHSEQADGPTSDGLIGALAWLRDGKGLLYTDKSAVWRIELDGNRARRVEKVLDGSFPNLTGDRQGHRLAFSKLSTDLNLWRTSRDGRTTDKLIASSAEDSDASYSPDGKQLLFRSNRSGAWELYACGPDGSGVHQLTQFGGHLGSGRWSPDGKWVAFDGVRGSDNVNRTNVFVVSSAGGAVRQLSPNAGDNIVPAWSPDGQWIYYLRQEGLHEGTWKVAFNGGPSVAVAPFGMFDIHPSPDGRWLYYTHYVGLSGIWRRATEGGEQELLKGTEGVQLFRYWGLAQGGIYFVSNRLHPVVQVLDLSTMRVRPLARIRGNLVRGPRGMAVAPDGSAFLYVEEDLTLSDIMLIDNLLE